MLDHSFSFLSRAVSNNRSKMCAVSEGCCSFIFFLLCFIMLVAPVETIPAGVLNWWFIHDYTCGCLVGVEALDNRCMGTAVARRISSPVRYEQNILLFQIISSPVIEVGTKYLAVSNYRKIPCAHLGSCPI